MASYVDAVYGVERMRGRKDQSSIGHPYCTGKLVGTLAHKILFQETCILLYSITSSEVDTLASVALYVIRGA